MTFQTDESFAFAEKRHDAIKASLQAAFRHVEGQDCKPDHLIAALMVYPNVYETPRAALASLACVLEAAARYVDANLPAPRA